MMMMTNSSSNPRMISSSTSSKHSSVSTPSVTKKDSSAPGTTGTTGTTTLQYPTGATVPFPYAQPYEQQVALMDALLEGIMIRHDTSNSTSNSTSAGTTSHNNNGLSKILCLESPTGTGKSLSLACASLAWLEYMEQKDMLEEEEEEKEEERAQAAAAASTSATPTAASTSLAATGTATATATVTPGTTTTISSTSTTPATPAATTTTTTSTGLSWLDEWQPPNDPEQDEQARRHAEERRLRQEERQRRTQLLRTLDSIRSELVLNGGGGGGGGGKKNGMDDQMQMERRENLVRQAVTKAKVVARKQQRIAAASSCNRRKRPKPVLLEYDESEEEEITTINSTTFHDDNDDDDDATFQRRRRKAAATVRGSPEWLLEAPAAPTSSSSTRLFKSTTSTSSSAATTTTPPGSTTGSSSTRRRRRPQRQIIYAARTHSQLSQFIGEVRNTHWGASTRVVALGSRSQGLCGYLTSSNIKSSNKSSSTTTTTSMSEATMTEQCLDLRQSKKRTSSSSSSSKNNGPSSCACPYYQPSAIATLALHSLATPTDLEDMVRLGQTTQTCAYYATRQAMAQAQLIVVPYTVLLDSKTRSSIGLDLSNAPLVLIDEAHNLPQAIEGVTSARLSLEICQAALAQVERYTRKYLLEQDRLNARHSQLLGQLKTLLKGFVKSLTSSKSTNSTPSTTSISSSNTKTKTLLSISQFLCDYRLDSINLFPLLRYLQESRLSQKLLGFMKDKETAVTGAVASITKSTTGDKAAAPTSSTITSTSSSSTLSSHISPMSIVESFLIKMNSYDPLHAKLVVNNNNSKTTTTMADDDSAAATGAASASASASLELVVLNPAVHAQDDLYKLPHAVCLVGGTLQPLPILMQELVPSLTTEAMQAQAMIQRRNFQNSTSTSIRYQSPSFVGFSCGHVVSPDHVLLQALTKVGSTTLDIRHATRSTPAVCQAIGQGILEICRVVPHGVVVFLPSYSYEQVLVNAWKTLKISTGAAGSGNNTTIWEALNQVKPLFREPKQRTQMEATLQDFSRTAESTKQGALLLAVVGGKLSEGINFANRLCRCVVVVGLPYADKSDPVLQEKLRYLETNNRSGGTNNNYYQALCLRAVNQSVGRAIRHAQDFAAIVVMDARYPRSNDIANGLPQWLTSSTPTWRQQEGHVEAVTRRLKGFFENPKFRDV